MNRGKSGSPVEAVILAAGKGTRMKSDLAKVLHELAGATLLDRVLEVVRAAGIGRTVIIVGHQADRVKASCAASDIVFVEQVPQNGTGHALQVAAPSLTAGGYSVVLSGDVPLLRRATLERLVEQGLAGQAAAVVLTCVVADAGTYGRIVKDSGGSFQRIVEARDATAEELAITEYNSGIYCFRTDALLLALARLQPDNDQKELYLTDTIGHLVAAGEVVETCIITDPNEVLGINTVAELADAATILNARDGDGQLSQ
ncbi:MAG: NTP transferase domain-containing protein [bacterium]